jgi:hypothetical protein
MTNQDLSASEKKQQRLLHITRRFTLNPHFHTLALDGIYVVDGKGKLVFRRVPPPSDVEITRVADRVYRRVAKLMDRRGLGPQADPDEADTLRHDQPLLAELYSASISERVATGRRAGRRVTRVGDAVDLENAGLPFGRHCAAVAGFSVHAGVCVPARDRMRLERLARYAGRPPLATERLSLLPDGRLLYRLKHRWRDGTTHMIFEPLELVEKLAALVPPPKVNLIRYHGLLAPAAAFRPLVIPETKGNGRPAHHGCRGKKQLSTAGAANVDEKGRNANARCRPRNYSWAELLRRIFSIDILACPRCGGRMRILAAINPPDAIKKILNCLGLPSRPPPIAPAILATADHSI